jgi:hypothetical protein
MQRMNELMALCNRFMLRRTSTVLKSLLPAKVEQVVFCRLSKLQLKLYNHFLHSQPVKALLASTLGEDGKGPPRKRKSTKTAAGAAAAAGAAEGGDQQEQQQEPGERKEMLAPLAAITGTHASGVAVVCVQHISPWLTARLGALHRPVLVHPCAACSLNRPRSPEEAVLPPGPHLGHAAQEAGSCIQRYAAAADPRAHDGAAPRVRASGVAGVCVAV